MIGAVAGCGIGMFGYGHFIQVGGSAYVVALFQGIMMVGVLIGTIAPVAYALDAYRDASNEIFIMNMLMKNFLFYGISYVANDWVVNDGGFDVMAVCAATSMFIVYSLIPTLLTTVSARYSYIHLGKAVAQLVDPPQSFDQMGTAIKRSDGNGRLISLVQFSKRLLSFI